MSVIPMVRSSAGRRALQGDGTRCVRFGFPCRARHPNMPRAGRLAKKTMISARSTELRYLLNGTFYRIAGLAARPHPGVGRTGREQRPIGASDARAHGTVGRTVADHPGGRPRAGADGRAEHRRRARLSARLNLPAAAWFARTDLRSSAAPAGSARTRAASRSRRGARCPRHPAPLLPPARPMPSADRPPPGAAPSPVLPAARPPR